MKFYTPSMGYIFLTIALVLNAAANILLKIAAPKAKYFLEMPLETALKENFLLPLGITLFALNVVFYIIALSKLNISVAYPIMAGGGLLIITLISVLSLKEQITIPQIIGIVLIFAGILLITTCKAN